VPTVELQFNRGHSEWVRELQAALEADGYEMELMPYEGFALDWELALRLGEHVANHVLDSLVALVLVHARKWGYPGESSPRRTVHVYGPNGKVLREVFVSAEGEAHLQANDGDASTSWPRRLRLWRRIGRRRPGGKRHGRPHAVPLHGASNVSGQSGPAVQQEPNSSSSQRGQ
jgi:hypothetical protein